MITNKDIVSRLTGAPSKLKRPKPISHTSSSSEIGAALTEDYEDEDEGDYEDEGEGLPYRPTEMYPPKVRSFIEAHGTSHINYVEVARLPIKSIISRVINAASFGRVAKKMKERNIDELRHLYIVLEIVNPISGEKSLWLSEKDEVIKIEQAISKGYPRKGQETMILGNPKNSITVSELFATLVAEDPNINIYDALSANCQMYVEHILKILGLWHADISKFVKQNTQQLVGSFLQKVGRKITDVARYANVLIEGAGEYEGGCDGLAECSCCDSGGAFPQEPLSPAEYTNAVSVRLMRQAIQRRQQHSEY